MRGISIRVAFEAVDARHGDAEAEFAPVRRRRLSKGSQALASAECATRLRRPSMESMEKVAADCAAACDASTPLEHNQHDSIERTFDRSYRVSLGHRILFSASGSNLRDF